MDRTSPTERTDLSRAARATGRLRHAQSVGRRHGAYPDGARLRGARDHQRRPGVRAGRRDGEGAVARRGPGPRPRHRGRDARCRSRRIWRTASATPPRRPPRRSAWRPIPVWPAPRSRTPPATGAADLRRLARGGAHRGGGRSCPRAALPVHAHRARRELPPWPTRSRRHHPQAAGVRSRGRGRAVRAGAARSERDPHGLWGGRQARERDHGPRGRRSSRSTISPPPACAGSASARPSRAPRSARSCARPARSGSTARSASPLTPPPSPISNRSWRHARAEAPASTEPTARTKKSGRVMQFTRRSGGWSRNTGTIHLCGARDNMEPGRCILTLA